MVEPLLPAESLERQPVTGGGGRFVLVADAWLTERGDLRGALGIPREQPLSDSALIMRAFERWKEDCVHHLSGAFAFAVWDTSDRTLFCARDPSGRRPLFYARLPQGFAFASSVRQLLDIPGVRRDLDLERVAGQLAHLVADHEGTYFSHIRRLPPAHRLTFGPGGSAQPRRYWSAQDMKMLRFADRDEYARELRRVLDDVVGEFASAPSPLGIKLSGGLDSSSLACLLARTLDRSGRRLAAFSSVLPEDHVGPEEDERPYMEMVVAQERNIDLTYVTGGDASPLDRLGDSIDILAAPPRNAFDYMNFRLWAEVKRQGVSLLMDGFGGDAFASYQHPAYFLQLLASGRLLTLDREMKLLARSYRMRRKDLVKHVLAPLVPDSWMRSNQRLNNGDPARLLELSSIHPDFARRQRVLERLAVQQKPLAWHKRWSLKARQYEELAAPTLFMTQEEVTAIATAHGIRPVSPFLDLRVAQVSLSAPIDAIHRDGYGRRLLRDAMADLLPPPIRWRVSKGAFTPDFHRRVARDRQRFAAEFERLEKVPEVAAMLDIPKLKAALAETPDGVSYNGWDLRTQMVLTTGHRVARFLEWAASLPPAASAPQPVAMGAE